MNPIRNGGPAAKTVRCALYTRKSTEEGLEQEFNSLDAQRDTPRSPGSPLPPFPANS